MKKPIIFSVLFFIITAISSFGEWIEQTFDPETGLRTGKVQTPFGTFVIEPGTNLSGANLRGANLSGANLRGADLSGANLLLTNLQRANLSRARFDIAENLTFTNFTAANLTEVNFSGRQLMGANFAAADLRGADFSKANLSQADLRGTNFTGANLNSSNLEGALIIDANLGGGAINGEDSRADLRYANLKGVNLSLATSKNPNDLKIVGADITGASDVVAFEKVRLLRKILEELKTLNQNVNTEGEIGALNALHEANLAEKNAEIALKELRIATLENRPTIEQVRDARAGSVVLTVDPEGDNITLGLTIEQSDNLTEWTKLDGEMTRTIPIPDGKKFYRFALDK